MHNVNRAVGVTITSSDGKSWEAKIQDHSDDNLKVGGLSAAEAEQIVAWVKTGHVAIDLENNQIIGHF